MGKVLLESKSATYTKNGTELIVKLKSKQFKIMDPYTFDFKMYKHPEIKSIWFHIPEDTFEQTKKMGGIIPYFITPKEEKYDLGGYLLLGIGIATITTFATHENKKSNLNNILNELVIKSAKSMIAIMGVSKLMISLLNCF